MKPLSLILFLTAILVFAGCAEVKEPMAEDTGEATESSTGTASVSDSETHDTETHTNNDSATASSTSEETDSDSSSASQNPTDPPIPGNGGTITITAVTADALTLAWDKASDDHTPQSNLEYKVVSSLSSNLDTLEGAQAGTPIRDWSKNIDTVDVSRLQPACAYYFNILVRDSFGNETVYNMATETTRRALDDLVAFFPFSGNSSDGGPNSIPLSSSTASPTLDANRDGLPSSSYLFTAANQEYFYNEDNPSPLGLSHELTVSVWVKLTDPATDQKVIGRAFRSSFYSGWLLGVASGGLYPEIWDSSGTRFSFNTGIIQPGEWTHLAITWRTGGTFRGYVNGIMHTEIEASLDPIGTSLGSIFRIGNRPYSTPLFLVDGNIDDIRVYGWELNETEIMALKNLPAD
ncbi:MAG: hypothetical protein MUC50_21245 [Myxococcota bacterium]|jgi:hypothetical protein|nr:hypothetical protein [Myxococcota bacterium]